MGVGLDSPFPDLLRSVEKFGIKVFIIRLPDEIEGAHRTKRDVSFVVLNQDKPIQRKRFTLAHELGHCFLGHGNRVDTAASFTSKEKFERDANAFGAALLMPRIAVVDWLSREGAVSDISRLVGFSLDFGVSAEAACFRLSSLNLITSGMKKKLLDAVGRREHTALVNEGIPMQDSLYAEHLNGGHAPFELQPRVRELAENERIDQAKAAELLRVNDSSVESILASTIDEGDVETQP